MSIVKSNYTGEIFTIESNSSLFGAVSSRQKKGGEAGN